VKIQSDSGSSDQPLERRSFGTTSSLDLLIKKFVNSTTNNYYNNDEHESTHGYCTC
jgi:hypothetical protein